MNVFKSVFLIFIFLGVSPLARAQTIEEQVTQWIESLNGIKEINETNRREFQMSADLLMWNLISYGPYDATGHKTITSLNSPLINKLSSETIVTLMRFIETWENKSWSSANDRERQGIHLATSLIEGLTKTHITSLEPLYGFLFYAEGWDQNEKQASVSFYIAVLETIFSSPLAQSNSKIRERMILLASRELANINRLNQPFHQLHSYLLMLFTNGKRPASVYASMLHENLRLKNLQGTGALSQELLIRELFDKAIILELVGKITDTEFKPKHRNVYLMFLDYIVFEHASTAEWFTSPQEWFAKMNAGEVQARLSKVRKGVFNGISPELKKAILGILSNRNPQTWEVNYTTAQFINLRVRYCETRFTVQ